MKAVVRPSMMSSWTVVPHPQPAFNILPLSLDLPKPSTECLLTANKTLNLFTFLLRIIINYTQFSVFKFLKLRHPHILQYDTIQPVSTVFSTGTSGLEDYGALTDIEHVNVSLKQIGIKSNIIQRLTHLQSFYNSLQPGSNYEKVIISREWQMNALFQCTHL